MGEPKNIATAQEIVPPVGAGTWSGEVAVLAASGASLDRSELEACYGRARVIAVNRTGELAPWADMLYAADIDFWKAYPELLSFPGEKRVAANLGNAEWRIRGLVEFAESMGVGAIAVTDDPGLSFDDRYVHSGGNSGYQALNIAVLRGVRRVLLLGYDMGGPRWHGEHGRGLRETRQRSYKQWRRNFIAAAEDAKRVGVEVINCSAQSTLECFPKASLRDGLE